MGPMSQPAIKLGTGMLLVFLAGVLWSTVGIGIRLIGDASVWQILLTRSFALSIFLALVIRLRARQGPLAAARKLGPIGALGSLGLVAAYAGGIFSIQTTSVANAMLLFATAPFMAAVLGWVILGEAVRRATWVAVCVAMIGILVMVSNQFGAGSTIGNLAALGSAFGFAVFTIILRRGRNTDMLPSVFLSGIFGVVITFAICLSLGISPVMDAHDTAIALTMGVFQVGLGLVLYTIGSKVVPAVELTLLSLAEVILGPLWVWLFLSETVGPNTVLGGAILLAAIGGNAISGARRKRLIPGP